MEMATATKKRLGEMLIDKGLVNEEQVDAAIIRQKQWGGMLGGNLVKLGFISEITLVKFVSSQLKLPCADLHRLKFDQKVYSLITREVAKKYHVFPLELKGDGAKKVLFLAVSDPTNMVAIDEVSFLTGLAVRPVIATETQISKALEKFYFGKNWIEIEPLSEAIKSPEYHGVEIINEVTIEDTGVKKKKICSDKNTELMALIRVLVKNGIISRDEYLKELQFLKEKY